MSYKFDESSYGHSAEELFDLYVQQHEEEDGISIDAMCAKYPEQAAELRRLHDIWLMAIDQFKTDIPSTGGASDFCASTLLTPFLDRSAQFSMRYRIVGEIKRGGMGAILRAHDLEVGREVALKVILDQHVILSGTQPVRVDDKVLARFLSEARITAQLDHPSVVPVHELGVDDRGRPFFAMKLVAGRDLKDVFPLARECRGGWSITRVLSVLMRVCDAVVYAHERGIVHRDLKPSNIMVGDFGEVYVMDWGIGKRMGQPETSGDFDLARPRPRPAASLQTTQRRAMGTPSYMSPEQARGAQDLVGPQTDVFALGAMLYELLGGDAPYRHGEAPVTPETVLERSREGAFVPLVPLPPFDSGSELVLICSRAMERDLNERYTHVRELLEDLRAFLESGNELATEPGPLPRAKELLERNWRLAAVLLIALGISLGSLSEIPWSSHFSGAWIQSDREVNAPLEMGSEFPNQE